MNVHPITAVASANQTQHVLHRDCELKSRLLLPKVGAHQYFTNPSTAMRCVAYAVDAGPVRLWWPGDRVPPEFVEAERNPEWVVSAHNDPFETGAEQHILKPRHNFPVVPSERHRCTMAMALALALPGKLELLARALDLLHQKDRAGERLMHMMAKPRRPHKGEDPAGIYWFDDADRIARLGEYCRQDVEVERELYQRLRPLSTNELQVWQLDRRINERGFRVDRALAEAALAVTQAAKPEIDAELARITGGAVTGVNQVARLKAWLATQSYPSKSLDRDSIEELLEKDLPRVVRRVLELRISGAQAAASKVKTLLAHCGDDNRVRGALRYHGASTGRWSGNGLQPQNLKRPDIDDLDAAIAAVGAGDYAHVAKLYARPLSVVGDITRSCVTAAPGKALIGFQLD